MNTPRGHGTPSRLRSFDPLRIADLEYRAWVGYCLRNWPQVLTASFGLVRAAMDLSDQWIKEGCQPGSPLLPLEHAALVRCYAALLAAVHHESPAAG